MRNVLCKILFIIPFLAAGQDIELKDLKTPNSPGFQILDISPSSIERPESPKAFAVSLYSLTSNGSVIPKNFAFEFAPYWYTKPKSASVYKYLNIAEKDSRNIYTGIVNKFSVSITSVYNDSVSGSLLANTNYIAIGFRTNLITLRSKSQNYAMNASVKAISQRLQDISDGINQDEKAALLNAINSLDEKIRKEPDAVKKAELTAESASLAAVVDKLDAAAPVEVEKKVKEDQIIRDNVKQLSAVPLFSLDAAFAYSDAIPENTYSEKRFNRNGFWLNGALSAFHTNDSDNLSIIACYRYLSTNIATNEDITEFSKQQSYDLGLKLEYKYKELTIAVEHLKRSFSEGEIEDTERTVGILQYRINDNLYLTGSYGKNFGEENNLFSLFGLNWNFGSTKVTK